jgi:transposase-like protein
MAARNNPKKNGRPTTYRAGYARLAFWMARAGMTNEQMAEELGIATSTLYKWKDKYPEFSEAIKKSRKEPDRQVEQSLFQRALGYDYEESKVVVEDGKPKRVERTKKFVPPDVVACIFWLKNRKPDRWRDKQQFEHTINGPLVIQRGNDKGR